MADLIARSRILVGFREYQPGESLPSNHPDAQAWVNYGSAVWRGEDAALSTPVKAKLVTAEPGLPGLAVGGEATGDELVGCVPITEQRRNPQCKLPASKT